MPKSESEKLQKNSEAKIQEANLDEQNRKLNLLYQAGTLFNQTLDLQEIYLTFYRMISGIMKCDTIYIASYDSLTRLITAEFAFTEGEQIKVSEFPPIPLEPEGQGIQSPVIRSGNPKMINNYQEELKRTNTNYYIDEEGSIVDEEDIPEDKPITRSAIILPMKLKNQVIGVIQIQSTEREAFTQEDLNMAEALVSQIAVAFNNAHLYLQSLREIESRKQAEDSINQYAKRLEKIVKLGRMLASTLEMKEVYKIIKEGLQDLIDCPNFGIVLYDQNQSLLTADFVVSDGEEIDTRHVPPLTFDPNNANAGRAKAIITRIPVIVDDLETKRKASGGMLIGGGPAPQSAIYVPMVAKGNVIGLLDLQSYNENEYSSEDGEWLSVVANQIGLSLQNAKLFSDEQQRLEYLTALRSVDMAIAGSGDIQLTMAIILDHVTKQLGIDAADILRYEPNSDTLRYANSNGFRTNALHHTVLKIGEGYAGSAAKNRKSVYIQDVRNSPNEFSRSPRFQEESFVFYAGIPLIAKGMIKGVLEVFHRNSIRRSEQWMELLEMLAGQAAIAFDNYESFESVQKSKLELSIAYDATIKGWAQALELKDQETQGHSDRVTDLTVQMSSLMGFKDHEIQHIRRGALLHDIGKIGIPDSILLKPGPLDEKEWEIMKTHPKKAFDILSEIDYLTQALDIPYYHHEKWDGTGYPSGLKGEHIPLSARIFAVVDVWDALISDRPYRKAFSRAAAREIIAEGSKTHFDPEVVERFMPLIK